MTGPGVSSPSQLDARIHDAIRRCWGFETLRPLQREAIEAGLSQTDSLVVMPTGGGKSLCYQVPPLLAQRLDVVVSPLISLMKDQVDGLRACGYPAAAIHSHLTSSERHAITQGLRRGEYRLLLVSPERLMKEEFLELLEALDIGAFAVDEAHCISHWGHDFRPEYRRLAMLKERFPGTSVHAFTATATPRVRNDIIEQLRLDDPNVLVGVFDRPNLVYRVLPRTNAPLQVADVLRRHRNEAAIVYCMTRVQTEKLAASLTGQGIKAEAYHAGMEAAARGRTQDAFAGESQANRRYLYFARQADIEGYPDVGGLFRNTAEAETGHAHDHPDYLKRVGDPATDKPIGDTDQNLAAAVAGETYEYTEMYPGMAKSAREEGFDEISDWFETLAKAEKSHAGRFQGLLDGLS